MVKLMNVRRKIRTTDETNLSSSSDIAFLLIIFFMVTSAFIFKDGLQMVLPAKSKSPKVIENKDEITIITVKEDSLLYNEENLSLAEIEQNLKDKIAQEPEAIVLVKFDGGVRYQRVLTVLDIMKVVNVQKLSFNMIEDKKG
jgi:biopolymer transport protein ExbD